MKSITYNNFAKIHRCVEYYEPLAKLLNYTARGHNLNFYVGWAKSFSCRPLPQ